MAGSTTCGALYVQGCARSGNTLMRELVAGGFANTELIEVPKLQSECAFDYFLNTLSKMRRKRNARILVGSRDKDSSLAMDPAALRAHPEVRVIWMLRHPFDVLTSHHDNHPTQYYVEPGRFITSLRLYRQFRDEPQVITVRYEDLVANPNAIQQMLADRLQLQPVCSFLEGHTRFSQNKLTILALHSIRPIDAKSVAKWRSEPRYADYLRQILAQNPEIIDLAREGNYDLTF